LIEDFYIKLLESEVHPEIPPGVLGNYEVALLYLQKFEIKNLSLELVKEINKEAFSAWTSVKNTVVMYKNGMEKMLPNNLNCNLWLELIDESFSGLESIGGDLDIYDCNFLQFPKLKRVEGSVFLGSPIVSTYNLNSLEEVGGELCLKGDRIYAKNIKKVGALLNIENSGISELPELVEVGTIIIRRSNLFKLPNLQKINKEFITNIKEFDYWAKYFRETDREHFIEKLVIG
jgi:hypothetical protein